MDIIDMNIIQLLKTNSRMTSSEIGKRVMLSVPAVSERIRKLEHEKIIKRFTIRLDRKKLDMGMLAFVLVRIDTAEHVPHFQEIVQNSDWILECHHIVGEYDYLLKVAAQNPEKLEIYVSHILRKTTGVVRTNTIIALASLKEE